MKLVVDIIKENFLEALKYDDVRELISFYIYQEYASNTTVADFIDIHANQSTIEIMDTIEFDVETLAKTLDMHNIHYSMFVIVDEDNENDDYNSIRDAKEIFSDLDIYSEYQSCWV